MLDEATVVAAGGSTDRAVAGRRLTRRGGRPRPGTDRPGVVVAVRLPGRRRLPRLPRRRTRAACAPPGSPTPATLRSGPTTRGLPPRWRVGTRCDFVGAARDRLAALAAHRPAGPPPVAVVAWDTELFGHWWHEGPQFLEHVLRMLPEAGVRPATLGQVTAEAAEPVRPPGRVVGRRQGLPAVGRRGGRRPRGGRPPGRGPAARRRTAVRAARVGAPPGPGRPGPRGAAGTVERLGVHGVAGQRRGVRAGQAPGARPPLRRPGRPRRGPRAAPRRVGGRRPRVPSRCPDPGRHRPPRLRRRRRGRNVVPVPPAREVTVPRLVALVVLTAAFAPAAVLGALPLLLLTMVVGVVDARRGRARAAAAAHGAGTRSGDSAHGRHDRLVRPHLARDLRVLAAPCRRAPPGARPRLPTTAPGRAPPVPGRRRRRCPAGTSPAPRCAPRARSRRPTSRAAQHRRLHADPHVGPDPHRRLHDALVLDRHGAGRRTGGRSRRRRPSRRRCTAARSRCRGSS